MHDMIFLWLVVGLLQAQGWQDFFPQDSVHGSTGRVSSVVSDPVSLEVMAYSANRGSLQYRFLTRVGTHYFLRGRYMKAVGYYGAALMGRRSTLSRRYRRRSFTAVRFSNLAGWGLVVALFTAGQFVRACEMARFLGIDASVLTGSMAKGRCLWVEIMQGTCSRQSVGDDAELTLPPELEGMDPRYTIAVLRWASEGDASALHSLLASGSPWSMVIRRFFAWHAAHSDVCLPSDD